QHPQLRAGTADGAEPRRRPQGRPRRRASDPLLPRDAQGRGSPGGGAMSVLVVGLSHRTAPVSLLERAAVPADDLRKTLDELHRAETISEVLLLSTCNRIEVYADVARFHPAVAEVTSVLARHAGLPVGDLADH